jgi:hypothetical protein
MNQEDASKSTIYQLFSSNSLPQLQEIKNFISPHGLKIFILFLCQLGALRNPGFCSDCQIHFIEGKVDLKFWYCSGNMCRKKKSIKTGSLFSNCKLSLLQLLDLMIHSLTKSKKTSVKQTSLVNDMESIKTWFDKFDMCLHDAYVVNVKKFGGIGKTVEI